MVFRRKKRIVNIVLDDYIIRMVENNGQDLTSISNTAEKIVPSQLIEHGKIVDELAFYDFLKETIDEWGIKKCHLRFYVPNELVIMREVELNEPVEEKELKQYITMEIGHSIHFPFKDPVFDIYNTSKLEAENKVTVLAAPEEELLKYTEIFDDLSLTPTIVDVQPLGVYRYFLTAYPQANKEQVYLFLELNLTSINFSIFHNHDLEFLRFQSLNLSIDDWEGEQTDQSVSWQYVGDETILTGEVEGQLSEIDRLMNFYRFSMNQGERQVTNIMLLGDYPYLEGLKEQIVNHYHISTTILSTEQVNSNDFRRDLIPALGLALRGDQ